ncbi:MAG: hypothetical protein Q8P72_06265, partial [Candidatus Roizmanbacteria bacterium]|nr:hypothetical protein [Candidatus Roizmanbacteria bacterium]
RNGIFLFIFFLPTQLGTFFFIPESYIDGIRIDYLAPAVYLTDILVIILIVITVIPHLPARLWRDAGSRHHEEDAETLRPCSGQASSA